MGGWVGGGGGSLPRFRILLVLLVLWRGHVLTHKQNRRCHVLPGQPVPAPRPDRYCSLRSKNPKGTLGWGTIVHISNMVPCRAMPCCAAPCRAVPCRVVPCRAMPCCAVPCRAMPSRAIPCHAVPWLPCHAAPVFFAMFRCFVIFKLLPTLTTTFRHVQHF